MIINKQQLFSLLTEKKIQTSSITPDISQVIYGLGFAMDLFLNLIRIYAIRTNIAGEQKKTFVIDHNMNLRPFHKRKLKKFYDLPIGPKKSKVEAELDKKLNPLIDNVFDLFDSNDFEYFEIKFTYNEQNDNFIVHDVAFCFDVRAIVDFVYIEKQMFRRHYKLHNYFRHNELTITDSSLIDHGVVMLPFSSDSQTIYIGNSSFLSYILSHNINFHTAFVLDQDLSYNFLETILDQISNKTSSITKIVFCILDKFKEANVKLLEFVINKKNST